MGLFNGRIFNKRVFNVNFFTHDGISVEEYKRYRKRIETAANAADKFNQNKYLKQSPKVIEAAEKLNIEVPIAKKIQQDIKENKAIQINYESLAKELTAVAYKIEKIIQYKLDIEEEETAAMLLM